MKVCHVSKNGVCMLYIESYKLRGLASHLGISDLVALLARIRVFFLSV